MYPLNSCYNLIKSKNLVSLLCKLICRKKMYFFKDFIQLFLRDTKRERQRHSRERSRLHAGSPTRLHPGSRVSRTTPWAEGRCLTAEPSRGPRKTMYYINTNQPAKETIIGKNCRQGGEQQIHFDWLMARVQHVQQQHPTGKIMISNRIKK